MNHSMLVAIAVLGSPAIASADIYKCVGASVTSYQSQPCAPGQRQTPMSVDTRPAQIASASPRSSRTGSAPGGRELVFRRRTIALGMSDDEVLNLRGWGVPTRIDRSREGRVPLESWRYDRPDGSVSRLEFTNARLTAMASEPATTIGYAAAAR